VRTYCFCNDGDGETISDMKPRDGKTPTTSTNLNLACQIRVKNTEAYRRKQLAMRGSWYDDENPPIHAPGDRSTGAASTRTATLENDDEDAQENEEKYAKCPHYRQLTAPRTAQLAQAELAPSHSTVQCCTTGGEKTRLGAMDIEDLVAFGVNPYRHRATIYRTSEESQPLGLTLGPANDAIGGCSVRKLRDDSPAALEGTLQEGDLLITVNGRSVQGLPMNRVVEAIRSAPNPVELEVIRQSGLQVDGLSQTYSQHAACPYYLSRELAQHAEIIFSPYNYLLDPGIRSAMGLDVNNAVIILDEGHNVEDTLREAGSGTFGEFELCDIILMLEDHSRVRKSRRNPEDDVDIGEICHELLLFVEHIVQFMRSSRERFEKKTGS
jgi:hypothetical protein